MVCAYLPRGPVHLRYDTLSNYDCPRAAQFCPNKWELQWLEAAAERFCR